MTPKQEADCMAYLAQGASVRGTAELAGVSEWDVAALFRPCRRSDRPSARPREARLRHDQRGRESAAPSESKPTRKPRPARPAHQALEAAE